VDGGLLEHDRWRAAGTSVAQVIGSWTYDEAGAVVLPTGHVGLPADPDALRAGLAEAWSRSPTERVAIACRGGRGRTGTAFACLAIIDAVGSRDAVDFVRERYDRRVVETPWQRRFVARCAL